MTLFSFPSRSITFSTALAGGLFLSSICKAQTDATNWTIVALTGEKISGSKVRLGSFGTPAINKKGAVAFYSIVYGSGINTLNNKTIVVKEKKRSRIVARTGPVTLAAAKPSTSSVSYDSIEPDIGFNAKKAVVFEGSISTFIPNPDTTQNTLLPVTGTFLSSATYNRVQELVAFASTDQYVNFPFTDAYPFNTIGTTFSINDKGKIGFSGASTNANLGGEVDGIWLGVPGLLGAVASVGDTVVGLPIGSTYSAFGPLSVANKGSTLYAVTNITGTGSAFDGVWFGNNARLEPFSIIGDSAGSSGTFATFSGAVGLSTNSKNAAFSATTSTGVSGIFWSENSGQPKLIASVGGKAPGTGSTFQSLTAPGVNNSGTVAFSGTATVGGTATTGIWAKSKNGSLVLIALGGDTVVINGNSKRVIDLRFQGSNGINTQGKVVFTASFSDRTSGVFTTSVN